jgi:hypothetical protein
VAELLDDVDGFEDGLGHLLNTVAGSIFVTLTMADSAEIAAYRASGEEPEASLAS